MKNSIKVLSTLAFLGTALVGMTACSSSDDVTDGGNVSTGEPQYLSVSIRNVQAGSGAAGAKAATRAGETFENGTSAEQKINKVRFYFFNSDGTPFALSNNGGHNWLEKTGAELGSNNSTGNVELISNAVLVLENNTGASPASMVAIVNPETLNNGTNPLVSGSTVLDKTATQLEASDLVSNSYYNTSTNSDFVMSNSVYDDNGTYRCAALTTGHIMNSADAAQQSPVVVYVERVNAKVRTKLSSVSTAEPTTLGQCGTITYNGAQTPAYLVSNFHGKDIYAVVLGWGIADENGQTPIEKNIGTTTEWQKWEADDYLGIDPWTTSDYHRSYWEVSTPFGSKAVTNKKVNHSWNDYKQTLTSDASVLYTLPNTPTDTTGYYNRDRNTQASDFTKVLVKAILVEKDADGKFQPATICSYKSLDYASMSDLKTAVAEEYKTYYTKSTGTNGTDVYTALTPDDISFSTSAQPGNSKSDPKDYQVVPCLADASKTYYQNTGTSSVPVWKEVTAAFINSEMDNYVADVRNEGRVYYYTTIRHLSDTYYPGNTKKLGYVGVVRNHLYDVTIGTMQGLGTPVYDPNKIIEPVVPSNAATFLAAQLNVLSWRVVGQTADLDATK